MCARKKNITSDVWWRPKYIYSTYIVCAYCRRGLSDNNVFFEKPTEDGKNRLFCVYILYMYTK